MTRQDPQDSGRWALIGLWVFSVASLAAYATFGRHPALLSSVPGGGWAYAWAYRVLPAGQVLVAFGTMVVLLRSVGWRRWVAALVGLYVASLGAELIGTSAGIPFGDYSYGTSMGPRWFGLVPLVIPLSWFYMALPSYVLVRRFMGGESVWIPVLAGAAVLTAWDLALDPAMSYATPMWQWAEEGAYYGMPWVNLAGWFGTGLLLMLLLRVLGVDAWSDRLGTGQLASFFAVNVLLPLGMAAAASLWGAVAATIAGYGAIGASLAAHRARASRSGLMRGSRVEGTTSATVVP